MSPEFKIDAVGHDVRVLSGHESLVIANQVATATQNSINSGDCYGVSPGDVEVVYEPISALQSSDIGEVILNDGTPQVIPEDVWFRLRSHIPATVVRFINTSPHQTDTQKTLDQTRAAAEKFDALRRSGELQQDVAVNYDNIVPIDQPDHVRQLLTFTSDGYRASQHVVHNFPGLVITRVMLSGNTDYSLAEAALVKGMDILQDKDWRHTDHNSTISQRAAQRIIENVRSSAGDMFLVTVDIQATDNTSDLHELLDEFHTATTEAHRKLLHGRQTMGRTALQDI